MGISRARRAAIEERRSRAIAMKVAGANWAQIATTLAYGGATPEARAANACTDVSRAMAQSRREQAAGIEELVQTEVMRLDHLQMRLWPAATGGDTKAADTVVRIIGQRIKLQKLDEIAGGVDGQLREELIRQVSTRLYSVFALVLDGLGLDDQQKELVPLLIQRALDELAGVQPRAIEGEFTGNMKTETDPTDMAGGA